MVLFDEVEKAHAQVLNVLLQVLDDGRLTDGKGRVVDFSNTVIFLTSNVGSRLLLSSAGQEGGAGGAGGAGDEVRKAVMEEVRAHFKPEFLNRLDEVVIFESLSQQQLRQVARLLLNDLAAPLARDNGITLSLTDAAIDHVVQEAYDPAYGARPIRRYLHTHTHTHTHTNTHTHTHKHTHTRTHARTHTYTHTHTHTHTHTGTCSGKLRPRWLASSLTHRLEFSKVLYIIMTFI